MPGIYDTGVANALCATPQHVRGTHPASARRSHGCVGMLCWHWCRVIIEAAMYSKRPSTRRDTSFPRAPRKKSDRCRESILSKPEIRHRCPKKVIYDTGPRSRQTPHPVPARCYDGCFIVSMLQGCHSTCDTVKPTRSSTRGEISYPRAPAANSNWCRKISLMYDTSVARSYLRHRVSRHTPRVVRIDQTLRTTDVPA